MGGGAHEDARSDEALMQAYCQGDHAAFRVLFDRYLPMLTRLTIRYTRSEPLTKEVIQQTFFQLHRARKDYNPSKPLRPWVFTIAMNIVRQHYRKRTRRAEQTLEAEHIGAIEPKELPMERAARVQGLRDALSLLPEGQRQVVVLHWFDEKPFTEVAKILGLSEGTTRVRAHRAYAKLKEILAKDETFADLAHTQDKVGSR